MDLENFRVNCSQISDLMGNAVGNKPPTEAEIRKLYSYLGHNFGELTEPMKNTAKEILTKSISYEPAKPSNKILTDIALIYAYEMYGKGKVSKGNDSPHQLEKGNIAEPESIKLLSKIDGIEYVKNEQKFVNKWFKGIPDIIIRDEKTEKVIKIIEIKTSYDLPSFILSKIKGETRKNMFEVMGYMDLTGCKNAEIVHVLVDMPEKIVSFEEKRIRERLEWFDVDEETILNRIDRTLYNMEYSNVPESLKVFRNPVTLNKLSMKSIKSRCTTAKKWVMDLHEKFTNSE